MNELCARGGGRGRDKFKLAILEKTILVEVKLNPLAGETMNSQGWWRVTTTLPFLDKNQSLTKNHGTNPLFHVAVSSLSPVAFPAPAASCRGLAVGTKCL